MLHFIIVPTIQDTPKNPCVPSPCGPFSQCRDDNNNLAICSCLPNYFGSPPNCKPECSINADCPNDLSCQNQQCKNPCLGSCGYSAECVVSNHNANCFCPVGTTGDPFKSCTQVIPCKTLILYSLNPIFNFNLLAKEPSFDDPCNPSPCGANAICNNGQCSCTSEYPKGDPIQGCRPECIQNNDCPINLACIRNKCSEPCTGICGSNALCDVYNHVATCSCPQGMSGNPFFECRPYQCMYLEF